MTAVALQARFPHMSPHSMVRQFADIFAKHPQLAFEFYCAASEIVDDFEDYGPVLQANEDSDYDGTCTIIKLRALRAEVLEKLKAASTK